MPIACAEPGPFPTDIYSTGSCITFARLSGRGHFAVVTLRVEPGPSPVRFINAARECGHAQAWVPAVEGGALQAVHAKAALGRRLADRCCVEW